MSEEYRVKFIIEENKWFDYYQEWAARNSSPGWSILYNDETYCFSSSIKEDTEKFSKKFGGEIYLSSVLIS